jgi:hypothetical protein
MAMRWSLIGASTIAAEHMIRAIRASGGEIAVVMSGDADRGRSYAATHDIPRSTTALGEALDGADMTVLVATAEDGAAAASVLGEICGHMGIQTTGLVFGEGRAAKVVSILRRHVRVLLVSGDEDDAPELLTAQRA